MTLGQRIALWLHDRLLALAGQLQDNEVRIPSHQDVLWPEDQCAACTEPFDPDEDEVRLLHLRYQRERPSAFWTMVLNVDTWWRHEHFRVHICESCQRDARRRLVLRTLVPFAGIVASVLVGRWLMVTAVTTWQAPAWIGALIMATALFGSIGGGIAFALHVGWLIDVNPDHEDGSMRLFKFENRSAATIFAEVNGTALHAQPGSGPQPSEERPYHSADENMDETDVNPKG